MATLFFLLSVLLLLVLSILFFVRLMRHKPVKAILIKAVALIICYTLIWMICWFRRADTSVSLGTDICFDDWCASITGVEKGPDIQNEFSSLAADSNWVVLDVKMSNHARGIAQKPSEPRIHIIDSNGKFWAYSKRGQHLAETKSGKQPDLDQRLELHQSLETKMVFSLPKTVQEFKILIEEGPFITQILFPEDRSVYYIKDNK